jgi:hypothetical protein
VRSGTGRYIVKSIQIGGRDVTHAPIAIAAARDISDVVIIFTSPVPTLNGAVFGDSAAVERSAVLLFPVEQEQWRGYGLAPTRLMAQPVSGAAYRFDAVPAGDYFAIAVDVAHIASWREPGFLAKAAAVATRVRIGWGEARVADLQLTRIQ